MKIRKPIATLSRPAVVMDIGGFPPPDDLAASWFGKVTLALDAEEWPESEGQPMLALCQINLAELPFKPPPLNDLAFISLFIDSSELPLDHDNGSTWCLRAYSDLSLLRPIKNTCENSPIKAFPMRARMVDKDYPSHYELGVEIEDLDEYIERYPNAEGLKLGGWPTLIQSTIEWNGSDQLKDIQYVFQVDSNENAHWEWSDGGVGYIGRGKTTAGTDEWLLRWQCL